MSGSAYTFSYATLGELIAWIIGWDLLLELMLGVETWLRFLIWMALGFINYFAYSRNHSLLATGEQFEEAEVPFEGGRVA